MIESIWMWKAGKKDMRSGDRNAYRYRFLKQNLIKIIFNLLQHITTITGNLCSGDAKSFGKSFNENLKSPWFREALSLLRADISFCFLNSDMHLSFEFASKKCWPGCWFFIIGTSSWLKTMNFQFRKKLAPWKDGLFGGGLTNHIKNKDEKLKKCEL